MDVRAHFTDQYKRFWENVCVEAIRPPGMTPWSFKFFFLKHYANALHRQKESGKEVTLGNCYTERWQGKLCWPFQTVLGKRLRWSYEIPCKSSAEFLNDKQHRSITLWVWCKKNRIDLEWYPKVLYRMLALRLAVIQNNITALARNSYNAEQKKLYAPQNER